MIRGIVFDMDGLLFDTERLAIEGTLLGAREMGLPITEEMVLRTIGCTAEATRAIFERELEREYDHARLNRRYHEYIEQVAARQGMPLKPGVQELLQELARLGLPAAVATSSRREVAEGYFAQTGLRHHFAAIVAGDMVARGKPAPDIYLQACRELGLPPAQCMALEDSRNGILAAAAAGMVAVMVPDLIQPDEQLRRQCHAVVESLHEVAGLLGDSLDC